MERQILLSQPVPVPTFHVDINALVLIKGLRELVKIEFCGEIHGYT